MIPAIKGLRKKKKLLPVLNTATSLVSMNYWRDPKPGFRREADFLLAKTNFVVHHLYATPKMLPLDLIIGTFWTLSRLGKRGWVKWHALFHISATGGMILIL